MALLIGGLFLVLLALSSAGKHCLLQFVYIIERSL